MARWMTIALRSIAVLAVDSSPRPVSILRLFAVVRA